MAEEKQAAEEKLKRCIKAKHVALSQLQAIVADQMQSYTKVGLCHYFCSLRPAHYRRPPPLTTLISPTTHQVVTPITPSPSELVLMANFTLRPWRW